MLREGDERGEGDGEFVGHQSPLPSPPRPAALPRSAHVSESSNTGPAAANTHTHTHTRVHTHAYTEAQMGRKHKFPHLTKIQRQIYRLRAET